MKIRVVTPWYPDYFSVSSGIFVAQQVTALRRLGHQVAVDVLQIFPAPAGPIPESVVGAMRALAGASLDAMFPTSEGVTFIPAPVPARGGPMGRARAMSAALAMLDEFRGEDSDLIHAHLGMPTAWAVAMERSDWPLVVTEHQSTLANVLAERVAVEAYAEIVQRASAFIAVSEHLASQITERLGEWARSRIDVIPNIADLGDITFRERSTPTFSSWIYVGGLMAHKGVQSLLEVFATYREHHDESATLTLVGAGPLREWVEDFADSHGLSESTRLVGGVTHDRLGAYLDEADVMVHLSPAETFGIATLEAIGAGLPVVSLRNSGAVATWGDIEEQCGLLLSLESSSREIASAIAELRDSPQRLDPVAGRQAIIDRYSPGVVASRLEEIYEGILS